MKAVAHWDAPRPLLLEWDCSGKSTVKLWQQSVGTAGEIPQGCEHTTMSHLMGVLFALALCTAAPDQPYTISTATDTFMPSFHHEANAAYFG